MVRTRLPESGEIWLLLLPLLMLLLLPLLLLLLLSLAKSGGPYNDRRFLAKTAFGAKFTSKNPFCKNEIICRFKEDNIGSKQEYSLMRLIHYFVLLGT